ncbi:MAG: type I pullulanase [Paludibacteraceae bacterium]|nr:type I pullulanase [Paludibacteraceae bacterium]
MRNTIITMLTVALLASSCARQPKMENECQYAQSQTAFAFWSPVAEQMEVRIYDEAVSDQPSVISLKKGRGDIWRGTIRGDQAGKFYTVRSFQNGEWSAESPGIFAKAVSINGQRGAIIDLQRTNPEGWDQDRRPAMPDKTDIVVYETHLRDFTMSPNSGIEHKGKFLALTEEGTKTADSLASGIDHLKELGITHLQVLPVFDYGSVDEQKAECSKLNAEGSYNWGYDPVNYNAPEGGYSTDPSDPAVRIREMKEMVQALHKAGIRVVMDVVYNHTYDVMGCALGRVVPQYFYRLNEDGSYANGSGCGNETASDHAMMRQFMVESVCYWAREYHIDGFRFDLMGIHDQETMRAIRAALDKIDPTILTYGEGWAAMAPAYPYEQLAMKQWTYTMPRVGAFSDDIRNALIGSPFDHERGFASGNTACKSAVCNGLVGCIGFEDPNGQLGAEPLRWAGEPMQHVSYITCHDNYCLRDRIEASAGEESEATKIRMNKLAQTAVLLSQGMSFIYGGEELFRTKQGIDNSYQSPDSINIIPWENKARYNDLYEYYRAMIAIRHAHKGFRLGSAEAVREHVSFLPIENEQVIVYRIANLEGIDSAKTLLVVFNGSAEAVETALPEGHYTILAEDGKADVEGLLCTEGPVLRVAPYSATVLAESER